MAICAKLHMKGATGTYSRIYSHRTSCHNNLETFPRCSACSLQLPPSVIGHTEFEAPRFMQESVCQNLKITVSLILTSKIPALGEENTL